MKRLVLSVALALGLSAPMAYAETPVQKISNAGMTCEQMLAIEYKELIKEDKETATSTLNKYAIKGCSPDALATKLKGPRIDVCEYVISLKNSYRGLLDTEGLLTKEESIDSIEMIYYLSAMTNALACDDVLE